MFNKNITKEKGAHAPDVGLIIVVVILLIFGLISLASASSVWAYYRFGDAYFYFKNQIIGLVIAGAAFWFFYKTNYNTWKNYAFYFLIFSIVLLLLVFIPGLSANYGKARSWINIGGFSLQPSEFVKLSFLLYLAAWLEVRKKDLHDYSLGIGPFVVVLGIISLLMILQPDIGTLLIISSVSLIVYFVGGGKKKHIIAIILAGVLSLFVMVQIKPYQLNRFKCMMDPSFSSHDICYQANQSLIAVGSGGFLGKGLGSSRQKYLYLPEVSGDSIFAIIAEEVGFVISVLLILCFFYMFYRGYMIAMYAPDDFGKNLAIGIVTWIVLQAIINIGGIISLMPMTGVPLPLISYGGSSILASMAALGILINISKYTSTRKVIRLK